MAENPEREDRLGAALRFVLRRYAAQVRRWPILAAGALLLPAVGDVLTLYAPPLVVARLLGAFADNGQLTAAELRPYVLTFVALWVSGQIVWRVAVAMIARIEIRGTGSALHRGDGRAAGQGPRVLPQQLRRLAHQARARLRAAVRGRVRRAWRSRSSASFLPLGFAGVVLWQYSPWLIVVLVGMLVTTFALMVPLIRRRRRLVDVRETASNVLAGHLADSIANAETVRAFAREADEARDARRQRPRLRRKDAAVLGLPEHAHRHGHVADVRADRTLGGLVVALAVGSRHGREPRGGVPHLQLLRDRDARDVGVQPRLPQPRKRADRRGAVRRAAARSAERRRSRRAPQPFCPADFGVELRDVELPLHAGQPLLFERFSLADCAGREGRPRRPIGRRQDDADAAAAAVRRTSRAARSWSAASRSIACRRPTLRNADRATCRRIRRCSTGASPTTSASAGPTRPTTRCGARRAWRTRRSSSRRCRTATRRSSASAA